MSSSSSRSSSRGLLLEALVARFVLADDDPHQLIRDEDEDENEDDRAILRELAHRWREFRRAETLPEWSTLLRAEIEQLVEGPR